MVVRLLPKDFGKLIGLSIFITPSPLVWHGMNLCLQSFAYKKEMQWWMFGVSGASALMIALGTVCIQAIKAPTANPVKSLRTD